MNKWYLSAVILSLAFANSAHATLIDGSIAVGAAGSGSFTSSSLTLSTTNIVDNGTGDLNIDFASSVAAAGAQLAGLSNSFTAENVSDYFQFAAPDAAAQGAGFPAEGTTPSNRFAFNLTGITETNTTYGDFTGTGVLVDTTGQLQATDASFTLGFAGSSTYSFSFSTNGVAAPEPSTWALLIAGAAGLLFVRRRLLA